MRAPCTIALVGDRSDAKLAHRAIAACFEAAAPSGVFGTWISTPALTGDLTALFSRFSGVWCVPGSPYLNTLGVFEAIRHARVSGLPFLGTCGGFQHAVLERARHVLGREDLGHEEQDSGVSDFLISRLACSLVEQKCPIVPVPGSLYESICGPGPRVEGFHCNFGLNPNFESLLAPAGLRVAARDEAGQVRAVEGVDRHPYFLGTLFQPERAVLGGSLHPLVSRFFEAARSRACPAAPP